MSLPLSVVLTELVTLSGGTVEIRGLTIGEVRACRKLDPDPSDQLAISMATGLPLAEAKAWHEQALAGDLIHLIGRIFILSKMEDGAQFQGAAADDAGPAGPAQ